MLSTYNSADMSLGFACTNACRLDMRVVFPFFTDRKYYQAMASHASFEAKGSGHQLDHTWVVAPPASFEAAGFVH